MLRNNRLLNPSRWIVPLAVVIALPITTSAQVPGTPPATSSPAPVTVLAYMNDLGLLRALVPLKLTAEQITPLVTILKQLAEEAKAQTALDEKALLALRPDVEKARTAALAGTPIPEDVEKQVAAAAKEALDRQKKTKTEAVRRILAVAKTVLTADQRTQIEAQSIKALGGRLVPTQYRANPDKAPREVVLDLATGSFIENVLLNDRAVTVLTEMAAAQPTPEAPATPNP